MVPAAPPIARSLALTLTTTFAPGLKTWFVEGCVICTSGAGFTGAAADPKTVSSAEVKVPPVELLVLLRSAIFSVQVPVEDSPQFLTVLKVQLA